MNAKWRLLGRQGGGMSTLTYTFHRASQCNMCGAPVDHFSVLGRRMNTSQGVRPTNKVGISVTVCQCEACGLIFPNPLPVPATLEQHYAVPPESYWKPSHFEVHPDYFAAQISTYERLRDAGGRAKVLDVGAGLGKAMRALENAGHDAYGVEPTSSFRERAIRSMGISPERLAQQSVEEATFPDGMFDWVTFGAVLEHLYDPDAALKKAIRMLRVGGLVHAEVPSSKWLTSRIGTLVYRMQGLDYVSNISPMHTPFHIYEFGLESFKQWAQKNGCELANHEYMVCSTYLPKLVDPFARWLMEKTDRGMQLVVWLRKGAAA